MRTRSQSRERRHVLDSPAVSDQIPLEISYRGVILPFGHEQDLRRQHVGEDGRTRRTAADALARDRDGLVVASCGLCLAMASMSQVSAAQQVVAFHEGEEAPWSDVRRTSGSTSDRGCVFAQEETAKKMAHSACSWVQEPHSWSWPACCNVAQGR